MMETNDNDIKMGLDRLSQVHEITINIPLGRRCCGLLYRSLITNLGMKYALGEKKTISGVHIDDVACIIVNSVERCAEKGYDTDIIAHVSSILKMFSNVKVVNMVFSHDRELLEKYENVFSMDYTGDKVELMNSLYKVESLEIRMSESLDRETVDFFNGVFIFYNYIPNDYMNRLFNIDFTFDEYVSFMEMFFNNNPDLSARLGKDVVNFFILFPTIVVESKPKIRLVTNYLDI